MAARNYFGVGLLRGLNSAAEVFAPYSAPHESLLGWSLAAGAVIAAAVVSLCHGPWQVSVTLVGIPVLGAVHALIKGRREKNGRRTIPWF